MPERCVGPGPPRAPRPLGHDAPPEGDPSDTPRPRHTSSVLQRGTLLARAPGEPCGLAVLPCRGLCLGRVVHAHARRRDADAHRPSVVVTASGGVAEASVLCRARVVVEVSGLRLLRSALGQSLARPTRV